jgi:hypothetical protein
MRACIFAGPSLPPTARARLPGVDWLPPAAQGDLYRAARAGPAAIGLIDGYFGSVASVWHKEILWALDRGIHVYGAASIGALRAAELAAFGMHGIGVIFADYHDGTLEDDDEVALLHGPAETEYVALSEPMVNFRAGFAASVQAGVLTAGQCALLTECAKALFYQERSLLAVIAVAERRGLSPHVAARLGAWWPDGRVDQKRLDALALQARIADHLAHPPPPFAPSWRLARTAQWETARQRAER